MFVGVHGFRALGDSVSRIRHVKLRNSCFFLGGGLCRCPGELKDPCTTIQNLLGSGGAPGGSGGTPGGPASGPGGPEALLEALRRVGGALDAGFTSVHDHTVGQRRGHHKIVLDDEGRLLQVGDDPAADDLCGDNTLLAVQAGGRLVEEIDRRGRAQADCDRNTL